MGRLEARIATALLVAGLLAAAPGAGVEQVEGVSIFLIPGVREFADATATGAIRRACAQDRAELEGLFAARGVYFDPSLLRRGNGLPYCHILFEPTLRGFRASADDEDVTGVFGALDPAGFVAGRKPLGDSLEILRSVLGSAPRPLRVTLTINQDYDPRHWPAAAERHFGGLPHEVEMRASRAAGTQPWAQDYVKSGWAGGEQKLLVPYRLFEGREQDGDLYRPLLDGLEEGRLVRSKLSWEGGDLQFVRDPRDKTRLVLVHGSSARTYWGKELDAAEYAYVLRQEFGADASIDMSGLAAHVDYVAVFLPKTATVLVSKLARSDVELARAAAAALVEAWGDKAPASFRDLRELLARSPLRAGETAIRRRLESARRDFAAIEDEVEPELARDLDAYASRHCPGSDACYEGAGRAGMLEREPALLARALDGIADVVVRTELTPRLLGLIEAQLRTGSWPREPLLSRKARELEELGFRVVRIPHLVAENAGAWPGVSYANSLVLENRIFMPALGLGSYEENIFESLGSELGGEYEIVPMRARYALLRNGGVHCVFGLVRGEP